MFVCICRFLGLCYLVSLLLGDCFLIWWYTCLVMWLNYLFVLNFVVVVFQFCGFVVLLLGWFGLEICCGYICLITLLGGFSLGFYLCLVFVFYWLTLFIGMISCGLLQCFGLLLFELRSVCLGCVFRWLCFMIWVLCGLRVVGFKILLYFSLWIAVWC